MPPLEQSLNSFVNWLIESKNFSPTTAPEVMTQIKEDLIAELQEVLATIIIAQLSPTQLQALDSLIEANDQTAIQDFLTSNIPDLNSKITQALTTFRQGYLKN